MCLPFWESKNERKTACEYEEKPKRASSPVLNYAKNHLKRVGDNGVKIFNIKVTSCVFAHKDI